jgi:acetyl esterase/lipase
LIAVLIALWAGQRALPVDAATPTAFEIVHNVVYAQPGGYVLRADIYQPHGTGPFPAVLCVHGGAWAVGNKYQMVPIAQRLAACGYAAVSIDYRHAPQFVFPAQLQDCQDALKWIRTHGRTYKFDVRRLGAWGYSAGAQLVTRMAFGPAPVAAPVVCPGGNGRGKWVGSNLPGGPEGASLKLDLPPFPPLKAVVAGGTPADFRDLPLDSRVLAYWLGGSRQEKPEIYEAASPAQFVSAQAPPVFFYHGDSDSLVPIGPVKSLMHQLEALGVPTAMYVVPGAGHLGAFFDSNALQQATDFLDKRLKGRD